MPSDEQYMATNRRLRLRVNDELVLDAGLCEKIEGPDGPEQRIAPPDTTLFHQVLAYLKDKPDPPHDRLASGAEPEGVAAAAVTLRWGSYLAVLLDSDKPLWREVHSPRTSRIHDAEMARINIEASAGLAELVDLLRTNKSRYDELIRRAIAYLPMPSLPLSPAFRQRMEREIGPFLALAGPRPGREFDLLKAGNHEVLARVERDAKAHPTRLFANTLLNIGWRNGPVEDLHAGQNRGYPLDERRITPEEEIDLLAFSGQRLALGLGLAERLARQRTGTSWWGQVLPFGLAQFAPRGWTIEETSREVRLPRGSR